MEPPEPAPPSPADRGSGANPSRTLAAGSAWSLIARFGHSAAMMAGTVVLARLLAPQDFGLVAISASLVILMLVIAEGLVDFPAVRTNDLSRDRLASLIWANLGVVVVLSALVWLGASSIERAFDIDNLGIALKATTAIFVLQVVMVAGRAILRRRHEFGKIARITFLSAVTYVASAIAMAWAGWGFWSLIGGQIVSNFMMAAQFAWASRLPLAPPARFDFSETARTGALGMVSRIFAWFWTSIDTIAIGLTLGAGATGLYSRAYNFSAQLKEPFAAIDHPLRQALVAVRERDGSIHLASIKILRLITVATSLVAAFCAVLRDEIVAVLLGSQWSDAALPLAILACALPARIALNLLDSALIVAGSMANLVGRQILLSIFIGALVWPAANLGIAAVAALVTAALYLALAIPVRAETGELPTRIELFGAVLPGFATGIVLGTICELALRPLLGGTLAYPLAVAALFSCVGIAWAVLYPTRQLIDVIAQMRERHLYSKIPFLKRFSR